MARGTGYFIDPEGKVLEVATTHIAAVISDPEVFGTKLKEIQAVYAEHDEPLGVEGEARREILKEALARGWIRLRAGRLESSGSPLSIFRRKKTNVFGPFSAPGAPSFPIVNL